MKRRSPHKSQLRHAAALAASITSLTACGLVEPVPGSQVQDASGILDQTIDAVVPPDSGAGDASFHSDATTHDSAAQQDAPGADAPKAGDATLDTAEDVADATLDTEDAADDSDAASDVSEEPLGCDAGFTVCGNVCTDTSTDSNNCGQCGVVCPSGESCQSGTCACIPTTTLCNGKCVDLKTDNQNCGVCGMACSAPSPSSAQCTGGRCLTTVFPDNNGSAQLCGVISDRTFLYWVSLRDNTLNMAPHGGGPTTTLATALRIGCGVSIDFLNGNLHWLDLGEHVVLSMPPTGGTPVVLATIGASNGLSLGSDQFSVYWTEPQGIMSAPLGGGAPVLLQAASGPSVLVADAVQHVCWAESNGLVVKKLTLGSGTVTVYPQVSSPVTAMAFRFMQRFTWVQLDGTVVIDGNTVIGPTPGGAYAAAELSPWVMWATDHDVRDTFGTTPTILVTNQFGITSMAVDSGGLYWTGNDGVMALWPPK